MTYLKDSYYDDIVVPNYFWCTFMEGKAMQKALELDEFNFRKGEPKM